MIVSVAHLDDDERALVLGVLLEEILTWVRSLSGSKRLRALVVFDEVYGFLPPHPANPPTKRPLVSLMKQARAFGVGVVIATQNPMDLDYRALGNAGMWCVGRLQTDGPRARAGGALQRDGQRRRPRRRWDELGGAVRHHEEIGAALVLDARCAFKDGHGADAAALGYDFYERADDGNGGSEGEGWGRDDLKAAGTIGRRSSPRIFSADHVRRDWHLYGLAARTCPQRDAGHQGAP